MCVTTMYYQCIVVSDVIIDMIAYNSIVPVSNTTSHGEGAIP